METTKIIKKKKSRVTLITLTSFLMVVALALSCVGIYLKISNKGGRPTVEVNPLDFSYDTWDGKTVNGINFNEAYAGRSSQTKTINSASAFVHFVNEVNSGNSFKDYTIYLNSNINLNGKTINSIGTEECAFEGTFDGGHYTIMDAKVNGKGLFNETNGATIKNVGLYNVSSNEESFALINNATNTNVENSFVRFGNGILVNSYVSNNGEHYIKNSFVDGDGIGLINKIDTNNSNENKVTISNCYFTQGDLAITETVGSTFVETINVVKATNKSDFENFNYSSDYSTDIEWCDYTHLEKTNELDFTYPIQSGFVKVYLTGSFYESVVTAGNTSVDAENLAVAFDEADKESEAEINLLVEKIFMEARAEVETAEVKINAVKDTTIVRGENNQDSMFVGTGSSKITIGEKAGVSTASGTSSRPTITLDGNREFIEENELTSGALIVANDVEIHDNVVIKDNINNNEVGYGGAVLLTDAKDEVTINATYENCSSTNGGGAVAILSSDEHVKLELGSYYNCSSNSKGGAVYLSNEIEEASVSAMRTLYGKGLNIQAVDQTGTEVSDGYNLTDSGNYSNNSIEANGVEDVLGGAIYCSGSMTISGSPTFSANSIYSGNSYNAMGGALYVVSTLTISGSPTFSSCMIEPVGQNSGSVAESKGGAIYVDVVEITTTGAPQFTDNEVVGFNDGEYGGSQGGAIYAESSVSILGSATFENNKAYYAYNSSSDTDQNCGGGAIFCSGTISISPATGKTVTFTNNNGGMFGNAIGMAVTYDIVSPSPGNNLTISGAVQFTGDVNTNGDYGYEIYAFSYETSISGVSGSPSIYVVDDAPASFTNCALGRTVISGATETTFSNCSFSNLTTSVNGGAVCLVAGTSAVFNSCTFSNNTVYGLSGEKGGAIYSDYPLTIENCTFTGNKATYNSEAGSAPYENTYYGGAVYCTGSVTLNGVNTFTSNSAHGSGGAIYAAGTVTINGNSQFTSNTADDGSNGGYADCYGGAVYADVVEISGNPTFTSNMADEKGGAIYGLSGVEISSGSPVFDSNYVFGQVASGGVTYSESFTVKSGAEPVFKNNYQESHNAYTDYTEEKHTGGGAVYITSQAEFESGSNTQFIGNRAGAISSYGVGGAIFNEGQCIINGEVLFKNNSADAQYSQNTGGSAIHTNNLTISYSANVVLDGNTSYKHEAIITEIYFTNSFSLNHHGLKCLSYGEDYLAAVYIPENKYISYSCYDESVSHDIEPTSAITVYKQGACVREASSEENPYSSADGHVIAFIGGLSSSGWISSCLPFYVVNRPYHEEAASEVDFSCSEIYNAYLCRGYSSSVGPSIVINDGGSNFFGFTVSEITGNVGETIKLPYVYSFSGNFTGTEPDPAMLTLNVPLDTTELLGQDLTATLLKEGTTTLVVGNSNCAETSTITIHAVSPIGFDKDTVNAEYDEAMADRTQIATVLMTLADSLSGTYYYTLESSNTSVAIPHSASDSAWYPYEGKIITTESKTATLKIAKYTKLASETSVSGNEQIYICGAGEAIITVKLYDKPAGANYTITSDPIATATFKIVVEQDVPAEDLTETLTLNKTEFNALYTSSSATSLGGYINVTSSADGYVSISSDNTDVVMFTNSIFQVSANSAYTFSNIYMVAQGKGTAVVTLELRKEYNASSTVYARTSLTINLLSASDCLLSELPTEVTVTKGATTSIQVEMKDGLDFYIQGLSGSGWTGTYDSNYINITGTTVGSYTLSCGFYVEDAYGQAESISWAPTINVVEPFFELSKTSVTTSVGVPINVNGTTTANSGSNGVTLTISSNAEGVVAVKTTTVEMSAGSTINLGDYLEILSDGTATITISAWNGTTFETITKTLTVNVKELDYLSVSHEIISVAQGAPINVTVGLISPYDYSSYWTLTSSDENIVEVAEPDYNYSLDFPNCHFALYPDYTNIDTYSTNISSYLTAKNLGTAIIYIQDVGTDSGIKTITVIVTPPELSAPTSLTWNEQTSVASWAAITNATAYQVQLYKDGEAVGSTVSTTSTSYDFSSNILAGGTGVYTFTVQAIGDETYGDSAMSSASENNNAVVVNVGVDNTSYGSVNVSKFIAQLNDAITVNGKKLTIGSTTITATETSDDDEYDYSFVEWLGLGGMSSLTRDIAVVASFKKELKNYTINIAVDSASAGYGSVNVSSVTVPYGTLVVFDENVLTIGSTVITATPTADTANYTYDFLSWKGKIEVVSGATTIYAQFTRETNQYTITFVSNNVDYGTVSHSTLTVDYGTSIASSSNTLTIAGTKVTATPKASTEKYTYKFDAWSGVTASVTGDMTITANFSVDVKTVTITVVSNNTAYGTVTVSTITAEYGSTIYAVDNVLTIGDGYSVAIANEKTTQSIYTFTGWSNAEGTVTANITITANFSQTTRQYKVNIVVNDASKGEVTTATVTVNYGTTIVIESNKITIGTTEITATAKDGYSFVEWLGVVGMVEGEITITAQFE